LYTNDMKHTTLTIGVVMGGPSSEHDVSIMTGKNVVEGLEEAGHQVTPIYVAKNGNWFLADVSGVAYDPIDICGRFDVMFNAMHGEYGEDGRVQQIFERCSVPYTGSGVAASALAMNKIVSKDILVRTGLRVPRAIVIRKDTYNPEKYFPEIHWMSASPWIVKPASLGSSVGVSLAKTFNELAQALEHIFTLDKAALVEEYIAGRELTCAVLEQFDGKKHFALHPVEIIPPEGRFFDYQVKYDGSTKEIPAPFFGEMLRQIQTTAIASHIAHGCRHYSRTDMILRGTKIYTLEINTLPGLTKESLFPKAAGWSKLELPKLLDHIVRLAI
jgi:D-alanine-D-alanine ligase